jgi:hypothetical protein
VNRRAQSHSGVRSRNRSQSVAISCNRSSPVAISRNQSQSVAIGHGRLQVIAAHAAHESGEGAQDEAAHATPEQWRNYERGYPSLKVVSQGGVHSSPMATHLTKEMCAPTGSKPERRVRWRRVLSRRAVRGGSLLRACLIRVRGGSPPHAFLIWVRAAPLPHAFLIWVRGGPLPHACLIWVRGGPLPHAFLIWASSPPRAPCDHYSL